MFPPVRLIALTALGGLTASLSACGGGGTEKNVAAPMQNMETVDGTINDAMTDLDGVQSEGAALAETAGNNSAAAHGNATAAKDADAAEGSASEAVADQ